MTFSNIRSISEDEFRLKKKTVLIKNYIRLPAERNIRTHSCLKTLWSIFLHVSLHLKLCQYRLQEQAIAYAHLPSHKRVIEGLWRRTAWSVVALKGQGNTVTIFFGKVFLFLFHATRLRKCLLEFVDTNSCQVKHQRLGKNFSSFSQSYKVRVDGYC